ncbi:hypothetical protein Q4R43_12570, partial [Morganella morganii]
RFTAQKNSECASHIFILIFEINLSQKIKNSDFLIRYLISILIKLFSLQISDNNSHLQKIHSPLSFICLPAITPEKTFHSPGHSLNYKEFSL